MSIYTFKLIIDHLASPDRNQQDGLQLFLCFAVLRFTAMIARGYYDLHVYNYYKFLTTQVQCMLFEQVCHLKQWQLSAQ